MNEKTRIAQDLLANADADRLPSVLAALGFDSPDEGAGSASDLRTACADLADVFPSILAALANAPDPDQALARMARLTTEAPQVDLRLLRQPEAREGAGALFGASAFLADLVIRRPELFPLVANSGLPADPGKALAAAPDDNTIRTTWEEAFVAAAVADLTGRESVERVLAFLSDLADRTVQAHMDLARAALTRRFGAPEGPDSPTTCCVFAMGKLGGREVNVSSDLDLVFVYGTEKGETAGGAAGRSLANPEYFTRLVHATCRGLEAMTPGGPYRIDLRLRPGGTRSDAACPVSFAVQYYQTFGQTWERQVWLRARPCAGDTAMGEQVLQQLQPFVYRKSLDWRDLADLRNLRDRTRKLAQKKGGVDVKLGRGGIREIEFITQSFQLIFGAGQPRLQAGHTVDVLAALGETGRLSSRETETLTAAYRFFRKVENALQWAQGRQTHRLPDSIRGRAALARLMGVDKDQARQRARAFNRLIGDHRAAVTEIFEALDFGLGDSEEWKGVVNPVTTESAPQDDSPDGVPAALAGFARLADDTPNPERAMRGLGRLADAYGSGSLEALVSDSAAAQILARLLAGSDYLGRVLIAAPELIDALLEPDELLLGKTPDEFARLLQQTGGDVAAVGEVVRQQQLRIGLRRILNEAGPETTMREASALAARTLGVLAASRKLTVLAHGALAGREMVFTSDLDLVFVLGDSDPTALFEATAQARALSRDLTVRQPSGPGYSVDMRLRPYGNQGALVASADGLLDYLAQTAAPWERAAYLRAEVLSGDALVADRLARAALSPGLDDSAFDSLVDTRRAGYRQRGQKDDLKWGRGGLADIELLLSVTLLAHGAQSPGLLVPGTLNALTAMSDHNLLDSGDAATLRDAFLFFKDLEHFLRTQFARPVTAMPDDDQRTGEVARGMRFADVDTLRAKVAATREAVERIVADRLGRSPY